MKPLLTTHRLKLELLTAVFLTVGLAYALITSASTPLFQTTEDFVLFATQDLKLEQEVQVSSGNLGSNNTISIEKEALITGNLFANKITVDKDTQINGNATFNQLTIKKDAEILGSQTTQVTLPIAAVPPLAPFNTGIITITIEGEDNTLDAGIFKSITLQQGSTLTLTGGTYTMNTLVLKEGSTLIYNAFTTLDIQEELKSHNNVAILPGANLVPDALMINYIGEQQQAQDKKNEKAQAGIRPITFGNNAFLNFKLLAPQAAVRIGERSTLRGQVIANRITVGKGSVVSREIGLVKETDPDKVIIDEDGSVFPVNEIIVNFVDEATSMDAQEVATLVDGQIVGFIQLMNAYQIEVPVTTPQELEVKIQIIKNLGDSLIEGVFRNSILEAE